METDEAGRLAAFRNRYGNTWNAATPSEASASASDDATESTQDSASTAASDLYDMEDQDDNLLDLISSFGQDGDKKK